MAVFFTMKKYYKISSWYWWSNLIYKLKCRFKSQQRWLTKKLPRTWADKDTIFEICLLEGIKNFVEGECPLGSEENIFAHFESSQKDPEHPEHQKLFEKELKECYDLITITLVELEKQLANEWDSVKIPIDDLGQWIKNLNDASLPYKYERIDELDKKIEDLKTKVMTWAVVNRQCMWT
jgi:hypothetical protein